MSAETSRPLPDSAWSADSGDPVLQRGVLTLAGTPIGHPLDASVRLIKALGEADVIVAEDTRKLKRLATDLGIRLEAQTWAYHEHNEVEKTPLLLGEVRSGKRVLLVTDAGMPAISDPGYRAVSAAREAGVPVDVFPGPSAPVTALVQSGLAPGRFAFEGFLPKTGSKRERALAVLAKEPRTLIFFESPRRTLDTLKSMAAAFGGDRTACVARELTKTYEEVLPGRLSQLVEWADSTEVLGEVVIVVAGYSGGADVDDLVGEVMDRVGAGERLKDAAKAVAKDHQGVSARELYDAGLAAHRSRG